MADPLQTTPLDLLSPKQRRYVEARLRNMPPQSAMRYAGYERISSHQIEQSPRVQTALSFARKQLSKVVNFDRDKVLEGLMDAVHTAASSTELTAAWREIGKMIGAYEPEKIQVDINVMTRDRLKTASEHELLIMAERKEQDAKHEVVEAIDAEYTRLAGALEQPKPVE